MYQSTLLRTLVLVLFLSPFAGATEQIGVLSGVVLFIAIVFIVIRVISVFRYGGGDLDSLMRGWSEAFSWKAIFVLIALMYLGLFLASVGV